MKSNLLHAPSDSRLLAFALLLLGASGTACGAADSGDSSDGDYSACCSNPPPTNDPPPSNAGDKYQAVGTNSFVMTSYDPLSTFAVDVDTASYDIFRRDIELGQLPQPDSVRLEEYINSFHYEYPIPRYDAEVPFSISLSAGEGIFERDSVMLRVGIQGKSAPDYKRAANIVFLVDTSGSMQGPDRLPLVKEVLSHSLSVLDPSDTIAIVTYAGSTRIALEPTRVADSESILSVLDDLNAGGSTAGAAGLDLAYRQAEAGFIEGGINHVVLCTDGDFNVGPSSTEALVELIQAKRKTGITLTALGFGTGNLNDAMMERVSNSGDGIYSVISSREQADRYAEEALLSTLVRIAKDVKIQVEINPERVIAYRLLGYEDRALADNEFRDDTVDAGEIGAGHRVTALYELVLNGDVPEVVGAPKPRDGKDYDGELDVSPSDLVRVNVRYKDVTATDETPASEVHASLAPKAVAHSIEDLDTDFQWAASIAELAEILKDSPFAEFGALNRIERIISSAAHDDYADRREFRQLFEQAKPMLKQR